VSRKAEECTESEGLRHELHARSSTRSACLNCHGKHLFCGLQVATVVIREMGRAVWAASQECCEIYKQTTDTKQGQDQPQIGDGADAAVSQHKAETRHAEAGLQGDVEPCVASAQSFTAQHFLLCQQLGYHSISIPKVPNAH